jgi:peptide/nickel transport system ATP-binding protein
VVGAADARIRLVETRTDSPRGCRFAARCPRHLGPVCDDSPPPVQEPAPGHRIACHIQFTSFRA